MHDAARRAYAEELYAAGRAHDAGEPDRLLRWRNVEPETAELLGLLVRAKRARNVLEIGTSNGYSTIWLGDAVEATGGSVVSLEIDAARTAIAAGHLESVGLRTSVDLRTEDAATALAAFADAAFDLIFLDAERDAYAGYWPDLVRTLAPAGLIAVDNVISHAHDLVAFRATVDGDDRVTPAVVPVGAGVLLAVRQPA
jgi:predicted O-methyltransferase YrrM